MIEALIQKVWSNPALATALDSLERQWLAKTLHLEVEPGAGVDVGRARRCIEAAAILACSAQADHRLTAYRMATYIYELFGGQIEGLEGAVRAVLTRLGNFPSLVTSQGINAALPHGPWSIAEEELRRRSENEVSIAGKPTALTDFQKELWNGLADGKSLAISAPTSTGKSFVLQAFLSHRFASKPGFSACYVVPTRALITQVHTDLAEALAEANGADVEIVTVPVEEGESLPDKAVFVFTQERLQILLKNHSQVSIDFLVIDEAHSVSDGDRGIILQSAIDELIVRNPEMQLLFASPTVSNLDIFSKMTGRDDISENKTDQIAVSQNFIDVEVISATRGEISVGTRNTGGRQEVGIIETGQHLLSRVECLVHLAHKFGAEKQSIVFADGQADAEKLAFQIADLRVQDGPDGVPESLKELSDLAKEAVHPKYLMALTVQHGVAFHYGNIPTVLRTAVEQAFVNGDLHYLVCTSTLLAGVNLPAKNLFLCQPKRRKGVPLDSVDFWNLAGRAGRLRREFQGNIYLINYKDWGALPLNGPRVSRVTPAIQETIEARSTDLESIILNDTDSGAADIGLETIFVRLLADFKRGRLAATFDRAGLSEAAGTRQSLERALASASEAVTLPANVFNASPTISAHRQQRLFEAFDGHIKREGVAGARSLLLAHPREATAFDTYVSALDLCHKIILRRPGTDKQNRFFALMLLRWMQGVSISELVDNRASYYKDENINTTIRSTLDLVENELRFNYVRAFSCYSAVLAEAFDVNGHSDLKKSIPSIPLYLEIGASDKTMISFIALGLSRLAAKQLSNISPVKTMGVPEAKAWLARQNLEVLGFSRYIQREVRQAIGETASA